MTSLETKQALAFSLDEAWASAHTVPAPSRQEPGLTVDDAYDIQDLIIQRRLDEGRSRVGWKLGLTSAGPGKTPIVGTILDDMALPSPAVLSVPTMVAPQVEAELIIRVGEAIDRQVSAAELRQGDHEVAPGIEVIDYRTVDSEGVVDWIADNSTVGYAVMGEPMLVRNLDLRAVDAVLHSEQGELARGRGDVVMGDPLEAVAWLSGHLQRRGLSLAEGDIILTGSLTGHHLVVPGSSTRFQAEFAGLGTAEASFST